jgi:single-stranded DNA-binding protein
VTFSTNRNIVILDGVVIGDPEDWDVGFSFELLHVDRWRNQNTKVWEKDGALWHCKVAGRLAYIARDMVEDGAVLRVLGEMRKETLPNRWGGLDEVPYILCWGDITAKPRHRSEQSKRTDAEDREDFVKGGDDVDDKNTGGG